MRTGPGDDYTPPRDGVSLAVSMRADAPQGQVALVGARIVTMADEAGGIIDDGVVLIDGNRIRVRSYQSGSIIGEIGLYTGSPRTATVIAESFRGKSRVQQHQLVYEALKGQMGGALSGCRFTIGATISSLPNRYWFVAR